MNEKESKITLNDLEEEILQTEDKFRVPESNKKEHFKLSLRKYSECTTIDTNNIYHSLQLDNLNLEKKRKNFNFSKISNEKAEDEFQIISKDDFMTNMSSMRDSCSSEDNPNQNSQSTGVSLNLSPIKKKSILESSIKLDQGELMNSSNNLNYSYWSYLSNGISKLTNNLKYNIITTNSYVKFHKLKFLRLFDTIFKEEEIKHLQAQDSSSKIFFAVSKIFQFTYRSDFEKITNQEVEYTSDCGWGCMIRAAQMMLSKFILENKIFKYTNLSGKEISINNQEDMILLNKLKYETLLLFLDNYMKIEEILENEDFKFYTENFQNLKNLKIFYNFENSEYSETPPALYISEVTPPFSIQNICRLGENFDKGAGIWFSDVIMSSIFCEINRELKPVSNTEFLHFKEGVIKEEDIHSFRFTHGCLIFVSVRLGLDSIVREYFESIRHIFKIPRNLGIIGGKKNSALFFIGEHSEKDKLIYLDPHVNQKAVKDSNSLLYSEFLTYSPKYFYNLNIGNMSPAFTTAFYFRNSQEYDELIKHLEIHSGFIFPVFKFKKIAENCNNHCECDCKCDMNKRNTQKLTKNVRILEDDDYCIVEYDDLKGMDK